ncbi:DUF4342 domain-containing protein [Guggenheimella bovis]
MENITLEKVEEITKRKNVSFSEAKKALEQTDGNVLEALAMIDQNEPNAMVDKVKDLIKKLHATKVSFEKPEKKLVNLPGTISLLLLIMAFPFTVVVSALLMFNGYKLKIRKENELLALGKELDTLQQNIESIGR